MIRTARTGLHNRFAIIQRSPGEQRLPLGRAFLETRSLGIFRPKELEYQ
jgi:hypothetical protein